MAGFERLRGLLRAGVILLKDGVQLLKVGGEILKAKRYRVLPCTKALLHTL